MLASVAQEPGRPLEILTADGQLDLRCFLHMAHPLAVHISRTDVEPVAIKNEPDCDFVWFARLATDLGAAATSVSPRAVEVSLVRWIP